mgnify:CR=1 FL=1
MQGGGARRIGIVLRRRLAAMVRVGNATNVFSMPIVKGVSAVGTTVVSRKIVCAGVKSARKHDPSVLTIAVSSVEMMIIVGQVSHASNCAVLIPGVGTIYSTARHARSGRLVARIFADL